MVSYQEAERLVLARMTPLPAAELALHEALGLVLARDVFAADDVPLFANSAMDGFAVRAADLGSASPGLPATLEVVEDLPAGAVAKRVVQPGTAARIMTGAVIPPGADSVVPLEEVETDGPRARFTAPTRAGANIRRAGEDLGAGELAVAAGSVLRPAEIALMAAVGRVRVPVVRRPVVAVLTTGSELVDAAEAPTPGQVRDANTHGIAAQVRAANGVAWPLARVADTREALATAVQRAVGAADVVVTSGGVSVGDLDLLKLVLVELGAEKVFWQVDQKPGKPLGFWLLRGKPVFGLPGNPVSAQLCFEVYVRPALRRLMGHSLLHRPESVLPLAGGYRKAREDTRVHWLRVRVGREGEREVARSTGAQGSGILSTLARANGLALIPDGVTEVPDGGEVTVRLLDLPEAR
jgi:molybdopterin molybdotransferase